MRKRFLQVCKNPICQKEFGILYEKIDDDENSRVRCPHCKKFNKVIMPKKKR